MWFWGKDVTKNRSSSGMGEPLRPYSRMASGWQVMNKNMVNSAQMFWFFPAIHRKRPVLYFPLTTTV